MKKCLLIISVVAVLLVNALMISCLSNISTQVNTRPTVSVATGSITATGGIESKHIFYAHTGQHVQGYFRPMQAGHVTLTIRNPQNELIYDYGHFNSGILVNLWVNFATDGNYTISLKGDSNITVLLYYQVE